MKIEQQNQIKEFLNEEFGVDTPTPLLFVLPSLTP